MFSAELSLANVIEATYQNIRKLCSGVFSRKRTFAVFPKISEVVLIYSNFRLEKYMIEASYQNTTKLCSGVFSSKQTFALYNDKVSYSVIQSR